MRKSDSLTGFLYRQLEETNKWLLFSETKNVTLVALNVAICSALSNFFEKHQVCVIIVLVGILAASLISLFSFCPNVSSGEKVNKRKGDLSHGSINATFWGSIVEIGDAKSYLSFLEENYSLFRGNGECQALCLDLAKEIVINSQIVAKKCEYFKLALGIEILVFMVMLIMLIVA